MATNSAGQQELLTLPLHPISLCFQQELTFLLLKLNFPCFDLSTICFVLLPFDHCITAYLLLLWYLQTFHKLGHVVIVLLDFLSAQ